MKPTPTESETINDPIIGYYVEFKNESPAFVFERQIVLRPLVATKPVIDEMRYSDMIDYLVWDNDGQTNCVWVDKDSFASFAAMYEHKPCEGFALKHRQIDSGSVQVWLQEIGAEHIGGSR